MGSHTLEMFAPDLIQMTQFYLVLLHISVLKGKIFDM